MLRVVAFGVHCELCDDDGRRCVEDHFTLTREEAEAKRGTRLCETCGYEPGQRVGRVLTVAGHLAGRDLAGRVLANRGIQRHHCLAPAEPKQRNRKEINLRYTEFARLGNGQGVVVRSDRGQSWNYRRPKDAWHGQSLQSLADEIRGYVSQCAEFDPVPPGWFVERLLRLHGLEVDPESVSSALRSPLIIEFGDRLLSHRMMHNLMR